MVKTWPEMIVEQSFRGFISKQSYTHTFSVFEAMMDVTTLDNKPLMAPEF